MGNTFINLAIISLILGAIIMLFIVPKCNTLWKKIMRAVAILLLVFTLISTVIGYKGNIKYVETRLPVAYSEVDELYSKIKSGQSTTDDREKYDELVREIEKLEDYIK